MAMRKRKTRLGYYRRAKRLTQDDMAAYLRVTARTVRNWEADITAPTRAQAEAIAKLLGVGVRDIFPHHGY